jgi:xanthine dehydrogenase YagR molybdenum-binding subunit
LLSGTSAVVKWGALGRTQPQRAGQGGHYPNHDLASYHIAAHADVQDIEAAWIDEDEPELGPMGAKGIGEVGIVGTAAAIVNAVYHATGIRVRHLPVRLDKLLR